MRNANTLLSCGLRPPKQKQCKSIVEGRKTEKTKKKTATDTGGKEKKHTQKALAHPTEQGPKEKAVGSDVHANNTVHQLEKGSCSITMGHHKAATWRGNHEISRGMQGWE